MDMGLVELVKTLMSTLILGEEKGVRRKGSIAVGEEQEKRQGTQRVRERVEGEKRQGEHGMNKGEEKSTREQFKYGQFIVQCVLFFLGSVKHETKSE